MRVLFCYKRNGENFFGKKLFPEAPFKKLYIGKVLPFAGTYKSYFFMKYNFCRDSSPNDIALFIKQRHINTTIRVVL